MNLRLASAEPAAWSLAVAAKPWAEPVAVAAGLADRPWTVALLSDGSADGRWSYVATEPERTLTLWPGEGGDGWREAAALLGALSPRAPASELPPFTGGLMGIAAYELGGRTEPTAPQPRHPDWPDLMLGLYSAVLAFDHHERRVLAIGRGPRQALAEARARRGAAWLSVAASSASPAVAPLANGWGAQDSRDHYAAAVAEVVQAIAAGEIFQANIARRWSGRLAADARPFDLFASLARESPAPFAGYLRLPDRALVSNSPERFVAVDSFGRAQTRPIKGTRPRGDTPETDARLSAELQASPKDRAENLMIVDLMRNDLARVCRPGTVEVPRLFEPKAYANVHHLVSTVTARLAPGRSALDLMAAAFPPGSITGAPKLQAMQVIARHEPPRGPFFGSAFWAGFDGALDSSVLIRTVGFVRDADGWRFEARAGAGIVADSEPVAETLETEAKIAALAASLTGRR